MRILYRYHLNYSMDFLLEKITIENTWPSTLSEYISTGVMYLGNLSELADKEYFHDGSYTSKQEFSNIELDDEYENFMNFTPYRSVWLKDPNSNNVIAPAIGSSLTLKKELTISSTKILNIGIFGDNQFQIYLDGVLVLFSNSDKTYSDNRFIHSNYFKYLHIFPIEVTQGTHTFEFKGISDGAVNDALGVIIWDNDIEDLLGDPPISKTSWNVLYSSEDSLSETIIIAIDVENDYVESGETIRVTPSYDYVTKNRISAYSIDWDDGTIDSGTGTPPLNFDHEYSTTGQKDITLSITLPTGVLTKTKSLTVI